MTDATGTPQADNRGVLALHLHGPQSPSVRYYARGTTPHTPNGYGVIDIGRAVGCLDLGVFVHEVEQCDAIAAAFTELAAKFRADPPPPPDAGPCRICGAQTRYVETFQGAGKADAPSLIHADAGIRVRDHHAELGRDEPAGE